MKNNKYIFAISILFVALSACGQNTESDAGLNSKAQTLLEQYMPQIKQDVQEDYPRIKRPDFASIKDTKEKKRTFVNFMLPFIQESNKEILTERKKLVVALSELEDEQAPISDSSLLKLCNRYAKNCDKEPAKAKLTYLLERVNIVPASLVLAQSANESAWGTSRFARDANNFFGQWCFSKGCGLVPKKRGKNQTHEVKTFSSPLASVKGYMYNINTANAYAQLRKIRARLVAEKKSISGVALAGGLIKYSERGQAYIDEVRHMIRYNKFSDYDRF